MDTLTQTINRPARVIRYSNGNEKRWATAKRKDSFILNLHGIGYSDYNAVVSFLDTMKGPLDNTWDITVPGQGTFTSMALAGPEVSFTMESEGVINCTLAVRQSITP